MTRMVTALLIAWVRCYQYLLAPLLGPACRFEPSCSRYMAEALQMHGPIGGLRLGLARLARCHPWGGAGYDPVPPPGQAARHPHPTSAGSPEFRP